MVNFNISNLRFFFGENSSFEKKSSHIVPILWEMYDYLEFIFLIFKGHGLFVDYFKWLTFNLTAFCFYWKNLYFRKSHQLYQYQIIEIV